ncbi:MAG: isoprenylcysteine carboxylmethyltransferase family protein [Methylococcaceae bacterium]|nr:isoprenylcysteine carboxylmethyltransferase family protein [Methylococcaceae bacterium]
MADYFRRVGDFLFHTRNLLFPVFLILFLYFFPPVALNSPGSYFLLYFGLISILIGQSIRMLTIGLAYIIRGGRKRRIYAKNLVTEGVFAHCRNPMYLGNIMLVIGFLSVSGNITGLLLGIILFLAIYRLIVHSEECFLSEQFSESYILYCAQVPRWLPNFQGLQETIANYKYCFDWPGVAIKEYGTLMTSLMTPLLLIGWKLQLLGLWDDYKMLIIGFAIIILTAYVSIRYLKKSKKMMSKRDRKYRGKNIAK